MNSSANANSSVPGTAPLRFGVFELDSRTGELRRSGMLVHLQPMPVKLLALLASRAGELVTREVIQRELWNSETYVDFERSINICVMQIRAALGDDAETPRFVETLPRRGYRFIAEVSRENGRCPAVTESAVRSPARTTWPVFWKWALWLVAAIIGISILSWVRKANHGVVRAPASSRVMLAVLPFENLSGNEKLEYVADGMTEELIVQLGQIAPERMGVIARTSAMRYRGAKESVRKIGAELQVQYVVEGSVRLEKSKAWITAQLIRVNDQTPVWAETFERDEASVFSIQHVVAARVAARLRDHLLPTDANLDATQVAKPASSTDAAAMDAYLQGRYLFHKGGTQNVAAGVEQFERAATADPAFAEAHAALADALHFGAMIGRYTMTEAAPRAKRAAASAIAADGSSSDAHAARGLVALWFEWNPETAAANFQRALQLNPSHAEAHHDYAWALVALGRDNEAVQEIQRAQALDPVSPRANMDVGWIYLGVRRYDDAIRFCTRMMEIEPRVFAAAQSCLESAYLHKGDARGAATAALQQLTRNPATAGSVASLQKLAPEDTLHEIWKMRLGERMTNESKRKAFRAAGLHLMLGNKQEALRLLEQAFAEREMLLVLLHRNPEFDALQTEPRFQRLLQQIKATQSSP